MEKRKVPAVRFKGFEDDWEQRKLGDYVEITSGEAPAKFQEGDINYVKVDDLNYAYKTVINTQNKVSKNSSAKMVQAGSVIFPKRGAAILTNKVRVLGVDSYMDTNMMALSSEKLDTDFLYTMLSKEGLYKIADTSTIPQINNKHIEPYKISLPKREEQHKIGTYFANLDYLITLHQRKLEKLYSVKKSMLEKMFPKNGSKIPEIRFEGFTDDWEQRKLGEILQERDIRTSDFKNNPLYSLTIENGITAKTDRYERSSLVTKTEDLFKVVKPNEFVTNPMNLRFGALGYNTNAFNVSVSGYYDVFSIDADKCSGFWNSYFKTPGSMKIFDNAATGSLIEKRRVKYSTLQELDFFMPKQIEEKILIGKYMDSLDHLITLHQRKLEKMKNIKKSLLEKLFTQ